MFGQSELIFTASGSIEFKDENGAGFDGDITFELCGIEFSVCTTFVLKYTNHSSKLTWEANPVTGPVDI